MGPSIEPRAENNLSDEEIAAGAARMRALES